MKDRLGIIWGCLISIHIMNMLMVMQGYAMPTASETADQADLTIQPGDIAMEYMAKALECQMLELVQQKITGKITTEDRLVNELKKAHELDKKEAMNAILSRNPETSTDWTDWDRGFNEKLKKMMNTLWKQEKRNLEAQLDTSCHQAYMQKALKVIREGKDHQPEERRKREATDETDLEVKKLMANMLLKEVRNLEAQLYPSLEHQAYAVKALRYYKEGKTYQPENGWRQETPELDLELTIVEILVKLASIGENNVNIIGNLYDDRLSELATIWNIEDAIQANKWKNEAKFDVNIQNLAARLNKIEEHQSIIGKRLVTDEIANKWRNENAELFKKWQTRVAKVEIIDSALKPLISSNNQVTLERLGTEFSKKMDAFMRKISSPLLRVDSFTQHEKTLKLNDKTDLELAFDRENAQLAYQVGEIEENADHLTYLANRYDNELIERIDKWNFENPGLNLGLENLTARMNITLAHQLASEWKIEDAKQIKKWESEDAELANKRKHEDAEILAAQFNKILEIQATRLERLTPIEWNDELQEKVIAFERDVILPLHAEKSINKGHTSQPEQRHRRDTDESGVELPFEEKLKNFFADKLAGLAKKLSRAKEKFSKDIIHDEINQAVTVITENIKDDNVVKALSAKDKLKEQRHRRDTDESGVELPFEEKLKNFPITAAKAAAATKIAVASKIPLAASLPLGAMGIFADKLAGLAKKLSRAKEKFSKDMVHDEIDQAVTVMTEKIEDEIGTQVQGYISQPEQRYRRDTDESSMELPFEEKLKNFPITAAKTAAATKIAIASKIPLAASLPLGAIGIFADKLAGLAKKLSRAKEKFSKDMIHDEIDQAVTVMTERIEDDNVVKALSAKEKLKAAATMVGSAKLGLASKLPSFAASGLSAVGQIFEKLSVGASNLASAKVDFANDILYREAERLKRISEDLKTLLTPEEYDEGEYSEWFDDKDDFQM